MAKQERTTIQSGTDDIRRLARTNPKTRGLQQQKQALERFIKRQLQRMKNLSYYKAKGVSTGLTKPLVKVSVAEHEMKMLKLHTTICEAQHRLSEINLRIQSGGQFNRQAVSRERHVVVDPGVVIAKSGRYYADGKMKSITELPVTRPATRELNPDGTAKGTVRKIVTP